MSERTYPHVQAAFVNAIREEGTKAEACDTLQALWNEHCALAAKIARLTAKVEAADRIVQAWDRVDECLIPGYDERSALGEEALYAMYGAVTAYKEAGK